MPPYTNVFPETLREYIELKIIPQYTCFDKAHRTDHVLKVIQKSLELASYYKINQKMVYTIAAYHDLGLCKGREFHHLVSGKMLLEDQTLKQWFTEKQLLTMEEAVEDHRASNEQVPRSIYGKIVAEADRIIEPDITLRRTVQYGLSHYPKLNKKEQYARFLKHLTDKYAEGGYLKLWIPQSSNAGQLKKLRQLITDKERLHKVFENIYAEETGTVQY